LEGYLWIYVICFRVVKAYFPFKTRKRLTAVVC
jgi:hypothetical protein